MLKKLPIGIQSFEFLRENVDEYVYVDKTQYLYNLIREGKAYFLSRPRRFGKSLTISTLQAIFENKRDLFKGLWIDKSYYNWKSYPVLNFNFALMNHESVSSLQKDIIFTLMKYAEKHNITLPPHLTLDQILQHVLQQCAAKGQRVVILVDEYDKPILDHITNQPLAQALRQTLAQFYGVIKNLDQYIKFVFITGVTKFSKTSIFSGLNNLNDLTLQQSAAVLCGYTEQELENHFTPYFQEIAQSKNVPLTVLKNDIKTWYNGYRFSSIPLIKIYNPFSILLFCKHKMFQDFWFKTGTPTFLINLIKEKNYPVIDFAHAEMNEFEMDSFDIDTLELKTLLLQTGYLTIESFNEAGCYYVLKYPNREVSQAINAHFMAMLVKIDSKYINAINRTIQESLTNYSIDQLCKTFQYFYDQIPYTIHLPQEKYWQSLIYVLLMQLGLQVRVEETTSLGRIDLLITTPHAFFIIEFKVDDTSGVALQQIKDKRYADKFEQTNKKVFLIGIAFDSKTKKLDYLWEAL